MKVEPDEVLLRIVRAGDERREIAIHLHYYLLADILRRLGRASPSTGPLTRHIFTRCKMVRLP